MCLTGNSKIQHDDWTFPTTNWIALIDAESFGSLMREKNYTYVCIWQVSEMLRNSSIGSIIFIRLPCWVGVGVFFVMAHFSHPNCISPYYLIVADPCMCVNVH